MKRDFILNRIIKVMLLVLSMTVGQNAWAESSWTVTNENSNTFTIKRSEKGYTQTVHFRTISLSAYAGQHFTAVDMDYTFPADEDEKTITVTEKNPTTDAYKYQTVTSRKYGFEVIDRAGFRLAYAERSKTWGTSVTSSGVFYTKDVTIQTSEYTADDRGYDNNGYKSVAASDYCNSGTQAYLGFLNAQLRMTLSFDAKENDDAYSYLQILVNNTTQCDGRGSASDGDPGTPSYSRYMAGFEMNTGSLDDSYKTYTFPVTSVGSGEGHSNPWGYGTTYPLSKQRFNTNCRADDGRLILPTNFQNLVLRLNASGKKGTDEWAVKNVKAHIQAIDATAPTKLAASVNPGRHSKGNTVYVSVAFSEIVTVSGTPTLSTTSENNWGNLTYVAGSGTNVLTFSTTIPQNAIGSLNITGFSGTITDLAGNALSAISHSNLCTLDADFAYTIDDFQQEGGNYLIKTHEDLIGLAGYVNGGGNTEGKTFLQVADITFAHTTDWNSSTSTENNYTAIGTHNSYFIGTFDGGGHTISGIRIYRGGTSNSDYQGLFGVVKKNGTVKRVTLSDARITGYHEVGGIAAHTFYSSIEDCTVDANVCIHAVESNSYDHGGIVGRNQAGPVNRCISRATLTVANSSGCKEFGGIVGLNYSNIITDCIAEGVVIPDVNARGAIVGFKDDYYGSTLTRNYYHGCKVASNSVTPSGVGQGTADSKTTSDVDGAQPLWAITLPTHASVVRTPATDPLPGTNNLTYDNGADINGVPYAKGSSVVNLSYDPATITEGYDVQLSVKQTSGNTAVAFTDNGNHTYTIASMPAADITVSATEIPVIAYIDADGNPQSQACIPIVSSNSDQKLGAEGCTNWYVVSGEVSTGKIQFKDATTNIILCDGATLTVSSSQSYEAICCEYGSINIFAQSGGTGAITISTACQSGIKAYYSIDINGGAITVSNASSIGIAASNGDVTIRRGRVDAYSYYGIAAFNNVNILGGIVNATCSSIGSRNGIRASNGNIILGCSSPSDRIYASNYYAKNNNVRVADGQILSDGTATYSGGLSSDEIAAIAGKTLSTAIPYIDADGTTKYKASKDLTFITTSTRTYGNAANTEGWYCVNSDVDFTDIVHFNDQMVNIILCDGATMSGERYLFESHSVIEVYSGSLAIYGQNHGTGTLSLNCTDKGSAISANTNIDINGGTVNATSRSGNGIKANNAIIIRRGNINAKGSPAAAGISASTVTLGCPTTADRIYATGYNGTVTIADGQTLTDGISANTYTNTLTDEQKAAVAGKTMMKALGNVSYIDENGQEQICSSYQILSDAIVKTSSNFNYIGSSGTDTWYVASSSYTINKTYLETRGHVHIILCDGANFTVNGSGSYGINATGNLSIYGQSQGTGTLTANVASASGKALNIYNCNLVVNGGVVNANGGEYGIYINRGHMTVNGGTINATGTTSDIYAGVRFEKVNGIQTANFSGTSLGTVHIPSAITVREVIYHRTFSAGKASTVMLPFDYTCNGNEGGSFYRFVGVEQEGNTLVATMQSTADALTANTPYLFMPTGTSITFTIPNEGVTLCTKGGGDGQTADAGSHWTFKGTYEYKEWIADGANSAEIGTVYGFAGVAKDGINVGDFVKVASGAKIRPMSAYLIWSNTANQAPAHGGMNAASASADKLPQSITVRLLGADGTVTNVGQIDMETGEVSFEGWYTLQGVKLDAEPTEPGIYINNGKKVSIK